jgi:hypothetical protein
MAETQTPERSGRHKERLPMAAIGAVLASNFVSAPALA